MKGLCQNVSRSENRWDSLAHVLVLLGTDDGRFADTLAREEGRVLDPALELQDQSETSVRNGAPVERDEGWTHLLVPSERADVVDDASGDLARVLVDRDDDTVVHDSLLGQKLG